MRCYDGNDPDLQANAGGWDKSNSSVYKWLHQRFPVFNNLTDNSLLVEGVENEHFIVWMRTAGLPTFRKLYATIGKNNGPDKVTLEKGKKVNKSIFCKYLKDAAHCPKTI